MDKDSKISLRHNYKWYSVESLFAFIVILSAGGTTKYQMYLYAVKSVESLILLFISLYLIAKHKKGHDIQKICKLILLLLVWGLLGTAISGYGCEYYALIFNIISSFAFYVCYEEEIFVRFEKTVTMLAALSLILFLVCMIVPWMTNLIYMLSIIDTSTGGTVDASIGVFGLSRTADTGAFFLNRRNLGFAWEPGRFASILVVAIFFNMVRNNFKLKNKGFYILFATLISTQSTTGYLAMLLPMLAYAYYKKSNVYIYIFAVLFVIAFFSISFMGEKVLNLWNWQENQSSQFYDDIDYYARNERIYVPQRFEGIFYEFLNFINSPIWGYGKDFANSYINKDIFKAGVIFCSNGCIQVLSQYGFLVGCLLYYFLYLSSRSLTNLYKYKGTFLFLILFVLINISYNFWAISVFTSFVMYGFYEKNKYRNSNV